MINTKICPICNTILEENIVTSRYAGNHSYKYKCKHGCFTHEYDSIRELVHIYDKLFNHNANNHNSIRGNIKASMEKEIKYWKTKHRYVARNLFGEWED